MWSLLGGNGWVGAVSHLQNRLNECFYQHILMFVCCEIKGLSATCGRFHELKALHTSGRRVLRNLLEIASIVTLSVSAWKEAASPGATVTEAGKPVKWGERTSSPGTTTASEHDENDSPQSLNASHVYTPGNTTQHIKHSLNKQDKTCCARNKTRYSPRNIVQKLQ